MLISIIIPSYKPQDYIYDCLDSISRQTLPHGEFEVIVVLNGCCQPYLDALQSYATSHTDIDIKIVQTDTPGVCNARNIGLDKARGEYICFIDDDDWISDNYLESLARMSSSSIVGESNFVQIDEANGKETPHFLNEAFKRCNATRGQASIWEQRSFFSVIYGKLLHRNIINGDRLNTNFKLGEDSLFMFTISRNVSQLRLSSPDTVYYIRQRAGSVSRSPISFKAKLPVLSGLIAAYTAAWLRHPLQYNFFLFLSRIIATAQKYFIKNYR